MGSWKQPPVCFTKHTEKGGGLIIPKIIFTSRYMRDAPAAQLENYVRYIATREEAEKIDESKRNLPATKNQQKLIRRLIRDSPSSKEVLEYTVFLRLTTSNALEFISSALEQNLDLTAKQRAMLCRYMKTSSENLRWYAAFHNEDHHPHVHLMVYC